MFENIQKNFNGLFGKVEPGKCRITMNGEIAVNCSNGDFKTYNLKKKRLTNVSNFCFDPGSEMFFVMPTSRVKIGDIILVAGKPKCVIGVNKESIKVIDYDNSEIREVVPERHVFMGSTYFYGKIVSMFGNALTKGKGLKNIMKMMVMSNLMGGGNNSNMGGLGQMMAMSIFMGDDKNPFEGMFDFNLDLGIADDDDDEDDDEVDVIDEGNEAEEED